MVSKSTIHTHNESAFLPDLHCLKSNLPSENHIVSKSEKLQGKGQHILQVTGGGKKGQHIFTQTDGFYNSSFLNWLWPSSDRDSLIEDHRPREPTSAPRLGVGGGGCLGLICGLNAPSPMLGEVILHTSALQLASPRLLSPHTNWLHRFADWAVIWNL